MRTENIIVMNKNVINAGTFKTGSNVVVVAVASSSDDNNNENGDDDDDDMKSL
jgi:hypothetical protein